MKGVRWSQAENERLDELLASGLDWPAISTRLGRSVDGCRRHATNMHLRVSFTRDPARNSAAISATWTPERRATAARLMSERRAWVKGQAAIEANREAALPRKSAKLKAAKAKWWDWCPPEFRDAYRALYRRGFSAPEARQIIEADIARAAAKRPEPQRHLSFDERLAAVRAGTATIYVRPSVAPALDGR